MEDGARAVRAFKMTMPFSKEDAQTQTDDANIKTGRVLTLIAIVPQLLFLFATLTDGALSWTAPAAAFAYAAFIFSFVGGYWWGVAFDREPQRPIILFIAVLPMLLCFALFLPWVLGWSWPGPQLVGLGIAIMAGFLVDWLILRSAVAVPGWLHIRLIASLGLGLSTMLIGFITLGSS
jgi:hypothetical protein